MISLPPGKGTVNRIYQNSHVYIPLSQGIPEFVIVGRLGKGTRYLFLSSTGENYKPELDHHLAINSEDMYIFRAATVYRRESVWIHKSGKVRMR